MLRRFLGHDQAHCFYATATASSIGAGGIEPPTSPSRPARAASALYPAIRSLAIYLGNQSIQKLLSPSNTDKQWRRPESNPQQPSCEDGSLTLRTCAPELNGAGGSRTRSLRSARALRSPCATTPRCFLRPASPSSKLTDIRSHHRNNEKALTSSQRSEAIAHPFTPAPVHPFICVGGGTRNRTSSS